MTDILALIFFALFFLLFGITSAIQSIRAIKRQTDKEKHKWEYRSHTMRAFCKSDPEHCSGPHDW